MLQTFLQESSFKLTKEQITGEKKYINEYGWIVLIADNLIQICTDCVWEYYPLNLPELAIQHLRGAYQVQKALEYALK